MAELTTDTTADGILANVCAALAAATQNAVAIFPGGVSLYETPEVFERVTDGARGWVCGVIPQHPQRALGDDNGEAGKVLLAFTVAVRLESKRGTGKGNGAAVSEMNTVADLVRQALRLDPTRGGRAHRLQFAGKYIDQTDVTGAPRLGPGKAGQVFFTAMVPAACGWTLNAAG